MDRKAGVAEGKTGGENRYMDGSRSGLKDRGRDAMTAALLGWPSQQSQGKNAN
jgi:hypothetical protein